MKLIYNYEDFRKPFKNSRSDYKFLHHQKLIFITKESADLQPMLNPELLTKLSTTNYPDRDQYLLPVVSSDTDNKDLAFILNRSSFLNPARFTRCLLQINQPNSALIIQWVIRELIPYAEKLKKSIEFTKDGIQLIEMADKQQNREPQQVLFAPVWVDSKKEDGIH